MQLTEILKKDWVRNRGNTKSLIIMTAFRLSHFFTVRKKSNRLVWVLGLPLMIAYRIGIEWVLGVELPAKTEVGPGLVIDHGQGLVVNDHTVIGENVLLRHCTTIGCKVNPDGTQGRSPVIGDRVDVGAQAVIVGDIRIGSDARIGAGSVVTKDVPDGAVMVGNPARNISRP